jgi:hypothetical protein
MRPRGAAAATVALLFALSLAGTAGASSAAISRAVGKIGFTRNRIGPQNGGGEPSVAIARHHTIYVSAPGDEMKFWRSTDAGRTWTQGTSPEAPSGDTSVNVDRSGAVYESNLNVITGDPNTLQVDVFKSFDQGETWPQKGSSATEDSNATGQPVPER